MTFTELSESLEEVKARGPAYGLSEERKSMLRPKSFGGKWNHFTVKASHSQ